MNDVFTADIGVISKFKDQFPINFNQPGCGVVKAPKVQKDTILLSSGGEHAEWLEWPWAVSIYVTTGGINEYKCTGNLISESVVLTAAHCLGVGQISHKRILVQAFNNKSKLFF